MGNKASPPDYSYQNTQLANFSIEHSTGEKQKPNVEELPCSDFFKNDDNFEEPTENDKMRMKQREQEDYDKLECLSPDVTLDAAREEKQDFNFPNDTDRNNEDRCI